MRKVRRDWDDKPKKLIRDSTINRVNKIVKNEGTIEDKDSSLYKDSYYYPKSKRKKGCKVRDKLNKYYHNKCAYCENNSATAEIEHYRPKGKVKENRDSRGYYWLISEWSNLLPACRDCNGGKLNEFPIMGSRVNPPPLLEDRTLDWDKCRLDNSPLKDEEPYLLHPEIDNPWEHLGFKLNKDKSGIEIIHIDTLDDKGKSKGKETIRICKLNRDDLQYVRLKRVKDGTCPLINSVFKQRSKGDIDDTGLAETLKDHFNTFQSYAEDEKQEFTLLWRCALSSEEHFRDLVLPRITIENQRRIVEAAFREYLEERDTSA